MISSWIVNMGERLVCCHVKVWVSGSVVLFTTPVVVVDLRTSPSRRPTFVSIFKHHWIEEAQHAKLDVLVIDPLAESSPAAET